MRNTEERFFLHKRNHTGGVTQRLSVEEFFDLQVTIAVTTWTIFPFIFDYFSDFSLNSYVTSVPVLKDQSRDPETWLCNTV